MYVCSLAVPIKKTFQDSVCPIEVCGNVCEVLKSGLHSFKDRLCVVKLVIYQHLLECITLFTQVKEGPHTIVHEHAPNCLIHGKVSTLFKYFAKFEYKFWMM